MVLYSLVRLSVDVWPKIDDFWLWPCETAMLAGTMYLFSTKPWTIHGTRQPWAMLVYQGGFRWGLTWKPKVVDSMSAWQSMTAAFPRSSGATLKECWRALTRLQREACVAAAACLIYFDLLYFIYTWWKFHFFHKAKMSMIACMHMPLTICLGRWYLVISLQNTRMILAGQSSSRATNKRPKIPGSETIAQVTVF